MNVDDLKVVKQYVYARFEVNPNLKCHTRSVMNMRQGETQSVSRKQKLSTKISTEAELVAVDDKSV